jgi:mycoredoxin-dependent peroxiredoxin
VESENPVSVGDFAPDFTLKDGDRNDVTLSSFRGEKNVVLVFYVLAFTNG